MTLTPKNYKQMVKHRLGRIKPLLEHLDFEHFDRAPARLYGKKDIPNARGEYICIEGGIGLVNDFQDLGIVALDVEGSDGQLIGLISPRGAQTYWTIPSDEAGRTCYSAPMKFVTYGASFFDSREDARLGASAHWALCGGQDTSGVSKEAKGHNLNVAMGHAPLYLGNAYMELGLDLNALKK